MIKVIKVGQGILLDCYGNGIVSRHGNQTLEKLDRTDMSFFRGSAEVPRFFKFLLGPEIFTNLQK